jgi:hypothetical protein
MKRRCSMKLDVCLGHEILPYITYYDIVNNLSSTNRVDERFAGFENAHTGTPVT